ncbi:hypothetical protein [Paraburkholderia adhaesiva]|uniref:hypothetical protein n=1 Tax=Paraburkholderia adhaesiva TaxID=2883244 RepID=UPI001F2C36C4|nr:hypothetical protein [Paraburkholderia adhaesiva]
MTDITIRILGDLSQLERTFRGGVAQIDRRCRELQRSAGKSLSELDRQLKSFAKDGRDVASSFSAIGRSVTAVERATGRLSSRRGLGTLAQEATQLNTQLARTPALASRAAHGMSMHGGNVHIGEGGVGVGALGIGMGRFGVPLAVGAAAVYGSKAMVDAASNYQLAAARFRTLKLGDQINKDAEDFARGTHVFGMSMTENMTMLRDMHEIMGNYEEAKAITPLFSRMLSANRIVFGEEGNRFDEKTFQALGKVIEMRGGTSSPEEMERQADYAQKVLTGSAGLVTPTDMLEFMKTGGVAARMLSNKAFYGESAPMLQEMGGSRFGTGLMSIQQNLGMGRASVQSVKELMRIGAIDPHMVEFTKIGTIKRMKPGGLKNMQAFNESKYEYLKDYLIPMIRKAGVVGPGGKLFYGDAITDQMMVNELNTLTSQRTGANVLAQMYLQRGKIDKNVAVTEGAAGLSDLENMSKNTLAGQQANFTAAWTDFKTVFGEQILPGATTLLKGATDLLRSAQGLSPDKALGGGAIAGGALLTAKLFGKTPVFAPGGTEAPGGELTPAAAARLTAGGKMLRGAKIGGIVGTATELVGAGVDAWNIYHDKTLSDQEKKLGYAQTAGKAVGGALGMAAGAAIGSIIPGFGTVVGGMLGSMAGSYLGEAVGKWGGEYAGEKIWGKPPEHKDASGTTPPEVLQPPQQLETAVNKGMVDAIKSTPQQVQLSITGHLSYDKPPQIWVTGSGPGGNLKTNVGITMQPQ